METPKERIKQFMAHLKMGQKAFEDRCGLSNGYINNIKENIGAGKLSQVTKAFPELNTEWLLTGKGDMLKDSTNFERIINNVPFYADLPVSGGSIMQYNDIKGYSTPCSINLPFTKTAEFSFPVIGCSMQPTVKEGDMVGVVHIDGFESCNPDRIYLIITRDNERMIKRINRYDKENNCIWLVSDNPQYEPFPIYIDNIVDVYKVVWKISFETM